MKRTFLVFLILLILPVYLLSQTVKTVGPGADYPTLKDAFDVINAGTIIGDIELQIIDNITEYATAELFESGFGGLSDYTSVKIYPVGAGNYTIDSDIDGPMISLDGADNVTIDGRVDATGSVKALTLVNISATTSAATIRFINDATYNDIKYCIIKGAELNPTGGIIFFSLAGTGDGNDNNIIENNDITCYWDGINQFRPLNAVYSEGTASFENSTNTIRDNNIYDFLNPGITSSGINIASNNTTWTISGNSFYETTSFNPTATVTFYALKLISSTGTGFVITDNFFGGNSTGCSGTWTKNANTRNNIFYSLYISTGTGTATSIQNNTIKNFNWSNSGNAIWYGMHIAAGAVNIGTVTGNTIGATSGTGSILFTAGATGATFYGINIASVGTVDCENNNIGSITVTNTSVYATNFYGINKISSAGTTTISNNTIGSLTTANSINASSISSANVQKVAGIMSLGTGAVTMNNNTIARLTNSTTNSSAGNAGSINGITSGAGTVIASDNSIYDLTIANANNAPNQTASVIGISLYGNTFVKTIAGNRIYNLSNTYSSFTGRVIGLYFIGNTGANTVSANFIHSLTVAGATNAASVYGVCVASGATTYYNNIISLGGNTLTNVYGFYETGVAGNNNSLYFNTIYINGNPSSGTNKSYCLYSATTTNTRNFRNNVFVNTRSTTGGSDLHYAMYIASTGGALTCDYNDYYVSGTGSKLGFYGTNMTALPIVTGQDINSQAVDPIFSAPGGTTATDYRIGTALIGVSGTGITTDYESTTRVNPTMGAFELPLNKWKGTTSTAWNIATNWTVNVPLGNNVALLFDDAPLNHCFLDTDHSVTSVTINQATYRLVTNGHKLTITGALNLTNGAQIDASASGSTLELAGASDQTLTAGILYQDKVYNLTVNNVNNILVSGTLDLLNALTTTSGLLDVTTNSPTLIYSGSSAQTINAAQFLLGKVFNLTISNSNIVSLISDLTVDNNLAITSGNITINAPNLLTVSGTLSNAAGNSGLIIKSAGNGNDAKLINDSPSVNASVELSLSGGAGTSGPAFHYFVPPVASTTIGTSIATVKANLGLTYFNGDLVSYNEPLAILNKNAGWQYFDGYNSTVGFTTLESTRGYNFYLTAPDKATFKGQLNAGSHSFNLTYTATNPSQGWNLVGNPYPCNYNLSGIAALTGTGDGVNNTAYFNHDGGYAYWNVGLGVGTTGFSEVVAPMQGFFVLATSAGSIDLPTTSKTVVSSAPLRSKGASTIKKMKLVLENGTVPDETILCLVDKATTGFDGDYDAYKLFGGGTTIPSIFTEINSVKYAINSVPEPAEGQLIVPLSIIIKTSGTYRIHISEFANIGTTKVVLKHGDIETVLSGDLIYTFTSPAGTFTNFQLIIGEAASPAIPETPDTPTVIEPITTETVKTWYSNSYLYISCPANILTDNGSLIIYDMQGKAVYTNNPFYLAPGETIQLDLNLPNGMYISRVMINGNLSVSKIVIY